MRPIDKGSVPLISGQPKTVSNYAAWRKDLIDRIGAYCCYCNIPLPNNAEVEHSQPKNPKPGFAAGSWTDWENMSLACGPCNRAKSNKPVSEATHYLPDKHNTTMALEYIVIDHPYRIGQRACVPRVATHPRVNAAMSQATIDLLELASCGMEDGKEVDRRWKLRAEALIQAQIVRKNWEVYGHRHQEGFIIQLKGQARSSGFFSIWMKVFEDVPEICLALIDAFPGTARNCFDPQGRPIPRNGHEI